MNCWATWQRQVSAVNLGKAALALQLGVTPAQPRMGAGQSGRRWAPACQSRPSGTGALLAKPSVGPFLRIEDASPRLAWGCKAFKPSLFNLTTAALRTLTRFSDLSCAPRWFLSPCSLLWKVPVVVFSAFCGASAFSLRSPTALSSSSFFIWVPKMPKLVPTALLSWSLSLPCPDGHFWKIHCDFFSFIFFLSFLN